MESQEQNENTLIVASCSGEEVNSKLQTEDCVPGGDDDERCDFAEIRGQCCSKEIT